MTAAPGSAGGSAVGGRAAAVVESLTASGRSLAIAESLTGGLLTDAIVQVPGASAVLRAAIVAYSTPLKTTLLGVPEELLAEHGAVHPEVAVRMAQGVREATALQGRPADVGVATTGAAGPDPTPVAPVGLVYVAVADAERAHVSEYRFAGDRAAIRTQAVAAALELLAEHVGARE